jgi:predicted dehydrogenase
MAAHHNRRTLRRLARLRFGLIGCGDIAEKRVARALRDSPVAELVAVASARAERAAAFAARHQVARSYPDWHELLHDTELDAVYLATPVRQHAEQAIAAAEAGKHVLCEKPMALDVSACERMLAAARHAKVRLGVAYYRHHYPVVRRLRELVEGGALGRIVLAQATACERFDPPAGHPRAWLLDASQSGGGPMFDFGCHRIELLLDLLGPPAWVRGFLSNVAFRERGVEDTCVAQMGFESGASAVLSVSHAALEPQDSFTLLGSKGSAHVAPLNGGGLRIVTAAGAREESLPPPANLHQPLVDDFADAVLAGREPQVTGEHGLAVNRVLQAIYSR